MALHSLKYDSHYAVDETKAGVFIYDGTASRFHEWEFRVGSRWESTKKEDCPKQMNSVIESLRGDAALLAMDLGKDILMKEDGTGLKKLVEAIRGHVFPQARAEAKELYKSGHKTQGVLSRQPHEPIVSYVNRRRRWWRLSPPPSPAVDV